MQYQFKCQSGFQVWSLYFTEECSSKLLKCNIKKLKLLRAKHWRKYIHLIKFINSCNGLIILTDEQLKHLQERKNKHYAIQSNLGNIIRSKNK